MPTNSTNSMTGLFRELYRDDVGAIKYLLKDSILLDEIKDIPGLWEGLQLDCNPLMTQLLIKENE